MLLPVSHYFSVSTCVGQITIVVIVLQSVRLANCLSCNQALFICCNSFFLLIRLNWLISSIIWEGKRTLPWHLLLHFWQFASLFLLQDTSVFLLLLFSPSRLPPPPSPPQNHSKKFAFYILHLICHYSLWRAASEKTLFFTFGCCYHTESHHSMSYFYSFLFCVVFLLKWFR